MHIHHIDNTAKPDILAKPIIDILIETNSLSVVDLLTPALNKAGFIQQTEKEALHWLASRQQA